MTSSASDDIHICGACKSQFIDVEAFIRHKHHKCGVAPSLEGAAATQTLTSDRNNTEEASCEGQRGPQPHQTAKQTGNKKLKNEKKFKCHYDGCSYASAYPKDLQRHLRVHTGERPYVCTICSKTFNRSDKFKAHERHHQGLKPYKCNECDYATSDGSSLKKHLRIHSDERPFRCQICQYASRNSSQLVVHLRTHTGDAPFECPTCQTKFKINSDLKRHLRMHTGERPYKCNLCNYSCAIKGNLKTHIRLNHSTENLQHCTQCSFTSPSRKLLHQHEKTHVPKPLHCTYPDCTYSCTSQVSLRNHNRIHNSDRPFRCEFCPYTSRQPGNVRFHMKKKHPEKVPSSKKQVATKVLHSQSSDPVPNCLPSSLNDNSSDSRTVKRSGRSRPLCVRSFKCHLCDAAFVREDSLRCHLRQHKQLAEKQEKSTGDDGSSSRPPLDGDCMIKRALQQSGVAIRPSNTTEVEESLQNHSETFLAVANSMENTTANQFLMEGQTESTTVLNSSHSTFETRSSNVEIDHTPSTTQILYQVQPGFQFVPYKPPSEPASSTTTVQYILQTTDRGCSAPIFFNPSSAMGSSVSLCPSEQTSTATILHHSDRMEMSQPQLVNYVLGSGGSTDQLGSLMTSGRTLLLSTGQVIPGNTQCSTVFVHPGNVVAANSTTNGGGGGSVPNLTIIQPSTETPSTSTATNSICSTSFEHNISDHGMIIAQQSCLPIDNQ